MRLPHDSREPVDRRIENIHLQKMCISLQGCILVTVNLSAFCQYRQNREFKVELF